jgi:hypothetical protein
MGYWEDHTLDIISLIGVGITAFFLWYQIRKQTNVDSVRFTIDYIDKVLTDNKEVIDILHNRVENNSVQFKSDKSVRILLNGFENTIQFVNNRTIRKTHALTMLRITLTMIKKDTEVQRIIKEAQGKNPTAFELLDKFLDKNIC